MNKITLKSLKQELDTLKTNKNSKVKTSPVNTHSQPKQSNSIGHDIKDSFIQRLYMKSGALSLFLITGILGYASKLPILKKLIAIASLWYGKTTIWKILSKIRKLFVLFNALIGVYVVFKSVGFSTDNILVGFNALGHQYLEILTNFTRKLFDWFFNLFDHKIIPNVPGEGPSKPKFKTPFWNPQYNNQPWGQKVYDLYDSGKFHPGGVFNINITSPTPWYRDWSTWLWVGGGICTIGFIYLGYKMYTEPSIIFDLFKSADTKGKGPGPAGPPSPIISTPDITIEDARLISSDSKIANAYSSTVYYLNPMNYIPSVAENKAKFEVFMDVQNDLNRSNRRLYPFTHVNPFDSWFTSVKKHFFGESVQEWTERSQRLMYANRVYESLKISQGTMEMVGGATPAISEVVWSSKGTPVASSIGLHAHTSNIADSINSGAVLSKLSKIPSTPIITPTTGWSEHALLKSGQTVYINMEFFEYYFIKYCHHFM